MELGAKKAKIKSQPTILPSIHFTDVLAVSDAREGELREARMGGMWNQLRIRALVTMPELLEWPRSTIFYSRGNSMRRTASGSLCSLVLLLLSIPTASQTGPSSAEQVKAIQDDPQVITANDYIDKNHAGILREWIAITEINAPSK